MMDIQPVRNEQDYDRTLAEIEGSNNKEAVTFRLSVEKRTRDTVGYPRLLQRIVTPQRWQLSCEMGGSLAV